MIIIFGHISYALYMHLNSSLKIGENTAREGSVTQVGGNAALQAIAAARAGAKVSLSGTVGNDLFGKNILDVMRREGINATAIAKDEKRQTGITTTLLDNEGTPTSINAIGANAKTHASQLPISAFNERTILLLQNDMPPQINIDIMQRAIDHGGKSIISLTQSGNTNDELLKIADLIIEKETGNAKGYNCFCGTMAACLQAGMDQETATHYAQTAGKLASEKGGGYSALPYLADIEKAL